MKNHEELLQHPDLVEFDALVSEEMTAADSAPGVDTAAEEINRSRSDSSKELPEKSLAPEEAKSLQELDNALFMDVNRLKALRSIMQDAERRGKTPEEARLDVMGVLRNIHQFNSKLPTADSSPTYAEQANHILDDTFSLLAKPEPEFSDYINSVGATAEDTYKNYEQKTYKNGAKHVYGVDVDGKRRHLSHDSVLESYGYSAQEAKDARKASGAEAEPAKARTEATEADEAQVDINPIEPVRGEDLSPKGMKARLSRMMEKAADGALRLGMGVASVVDAAKRLGRKVDSYYADEEKGKKRRRITGAIVGATTIIGAGVVVYKYGIDTPSAEVAEVLGESGDAVDTSSPEGLPLAFVDVPIEAGEGTSHVAKKMLGIDFDTVEQWNRFNSETNPLFEGLDGVYKDAATGEWRIASPGNQKVPQAVLDEMQRVADEIKAGN